ncbi:MAG: NUDIX domain-containing protein [Candidatus Buchananbacteria bacterium]
MRHRATGLVIKDEKILLIFRRKNTREYWVFPGGGIEKNEDFQKAVVREVKEETSIEVKPERLLYVITLDDGTINEFYLCQYRSGQVQLGQTANEGRDQSEQNFYEPRWVDLSELPKILLYPLEVRDWLIQDLATGLNNQVKEAKFVLSQMRKE